MTGTELMAVVGFGVMVFGALFALWRYVEAKISAARDKADSVERDLAKHRLHCAEIFATKQGMQEQTTQLLRAIESVGSRIDGMNERLDRAFEHPQIHTAPRRRQT